LAALTKEAQGMKGYLIEVQGFASTSGNAGKNQQLSQDRAENIVDFLHQQGVPLKNIVNPAAMGTTNPVAGNDTEEDRLKNQRVEVKMLVNRGLSSNK
jgi:OmpA-OmpF porin, OOP family